ncbi:hypothetical protein [Lachnotalea glycerini]|uniref:Uncharacterized protein n=1 Tax=Lachnotalea glycerini TaxID=1763509 RepID=A0A371JCA8_9FIRM|nr:hypothetical protein [Lachnotalea glycerini]RDY30318.1 hypothetical protein CG710_015405 [Lachnotalea glycerini]
MKKLINSIKVVRINICVKLHMNGFTTLAYFVDKETCTYLDYMKRVARIVKEHCINESDD